MITDMTATMAKGLKGIGLGTFRAGLAAGVGALIWMQQHYVTVDMDELRWRSHNQLHEERSKALEARLNSIDSRLAAIDSKLERAQTPLRRITNEATAGR